MTEILFDEDTDWEKRVLCSDEACIGTIGPDGKCRECGKDFEGTIPEGFSATDDHRISSGRRQEATIMVAQEPDDDWEKRVLCSDGSCIGVIGPDGKCKECGKPSSS